MIRSYTELSKLKTFDERFEYLKLNGGVGESTFGFDRYINQAFYKSEEWKRVRDKVIIRDGGCDLGIEGETIPQHIYIHHMNPLTAEDLVSRSENLMNPEYLICVSFDTHNAIHYGDGDPSHRKVVERRHNDTCPWKKD